MATTESDGGRSDEPVPRFIDVQVLSQLPDQAVIHLHRLLAGTTVQELKEHIRAIVRSHPAASNQRLIYRGRVLIDDAATLQSVFGTEITAQTTPHNLHLVIRESHSVNPPNQAHQNLALPSTGTVPHPTPAQPIIARPADASHTMPLRPIPGSPAFGRGPAAPANPLGALNPNAAPNGQIPPLFTLPLLQPHGHATQNFPEAPVPAVLPQTPFGFQNPAGTLPGHPRFPPAVIQQHQAAQQHLLQTQRALNELPHLLSQRGEQSLNEILEMTQRVQQQAEGIQQQLQHLGNHPALQQTGVNELSGGEASAASTSNGVAISGPQQQSHQAAQSPQPQGIDTPQIVDHPIQSASQSLPWQSSQAYNYTGQIVGADGRTINIAGGSTGRMPPGMVMPGFPPPNLLQQGVLGPFQGGMRGPMPVPSMGFYGFARISPNERWLGPRHAIQALEELHRRFEELIQRYGQLRNASTGPLGNHQLFEEEIGRSRSDIDFIVRERNEHQQVVNSTLANGAPNGHTPPSTSDILTLQSLHDRFAASVQSFVNGESERRPAALAAVASDASTRMRSSESGEATLRSTTTLGTASASGQTRQANLRETVIAGEDTASSVQPAAAYLLSSPNGPHAIIYTPQGIFCSRSTGPILPNSSVGHRVQLAAATGPSPLWQQSSQVLHQGIIDQTPTAAAAQSHQQPHAQTQPNEQDAEVRRVRNRLAQVANNHPNVPDVNNPNVRAYAINLTPLFRAIWLFVRIYGMMWLFLGGTGNSWVSWRMLALFTGSVVYWAVQAGFGQDWVQWAQQQWNHLIGMDIPLAPGAEPPEPPGRGFLWGEEPRPTPAAEVAGGNGVDDGATQPRIVRRNENTNAVRDFLRPIERTVMLFIASLYPGVGERTVAAREREQREEAEREVERNRAAAATADAAQQAARDESSAQGQRRTTQENANYGSTDKAMTQTASLTQTEEQPGASSTTEGSSSAVARREGQDGLTDRRGGIASDW